MILLNVKSGNLLKKILSDKEINLLQHLASRLFWFWLSQSMNNIFMALLN